MRIHRLKFCSIGPYAEPQDLDFDALSQAGVFLFTGPTGAGKSTILDAISLALYNAPVKKRGDRSEAVVSNHADLEAHPPEVELEFSVGEHRYRIHRRLSHSSYAKRGQRRLVSRAGTVNLFRVHGENLTPLGNRQDEVGRQIQDIVNLSREQFTKVMMLPQGEFAEFLTANSEERRAILERLFDTGRFQRLTEILKERAKAASEQFHEQLQQKERVQNHLLSRATNTLGWVPADDEPEFADAVADIQERCGRELAELGTAATEAEQRLARLSQEQRRITGEQEAVQVYQNYARRLAQLEEGKPDYLSAAERLTRHHAAMGLWADIRAAHAASERLSSATSRANELRGQAERAFDHAAWLDDPERLSAQATQLEEDREAIALAIAAEEAATQVKEQIAKNHQQQQAAQQARQRLQQHREALAQQLANVAAELTSLPDQAPVVAALTERRAEAAQLTPLRAELVQADLDREERQTDVVARQREHLQARTAHSDLLAKQYEQASLLLASQLTAGEPCAVCGSTEHPAPAAADGTDEPLVTKTQLDRAKKAEQTAETALRDAERALNAARGAEQQLRERYRLLLVSLQIEQLPGSLESTPDLLSEEVSAAVAEHASRLADELDAATGKQDQRDQALRTQERLQAETDQAKQEEERLARELEGLSATGTTLQRQLAVHEERYRPWAQRHEDLTAAREQAATKLGLLQQLQRATEELAHAKAEASQAASALADQLAESSFADAAHVEAARLAGPELKQVEQRVEAYLREEAQLTELARNDQCTLGAGLDRSDAAQARRQEQLTEIGQESERLAASVRDQHGRIGELSGFRRELAEGLQELQVLEDEQREELEQVTHAVHVAAVADGTDNDRRISLPIYVLAAKLEKVATEASRHLMEMTDGRYEIRYDDERSGVAKAGLGLKISDAWTGQERGTRSLSGGESFMASLALALGLADVVQQESGGVSMETLFIDEGFGSLDAATLDDVMKTIQRLFDYGRVVGLVSHVEDMKNDIPTQIRIAATAQGSTARVVTG